MQQRVLLLLLKKISQLKLEPRRIQNVKLMWQPVDTEIDSGSGAWGAGRGAVTWDSSQLCAWSVGQCRAVGAVCSRLQLSVLCSL